MPRSLHQRTALITGASSGLGADFARVFAKLECDLVLLARSEDLLLKLKEEIISKYHVKVTLIILDLTAHRASESLYQQLKDAGIQIDILINNAGFGNYGEFKDQPLDKDVNLIELNVAVPVKLTKLFLPDLLKQGSGYLLFVSSIAAYQPIPLYASYAASKSFLLSFGEALHAELKDTGLHCTVLCPGVTQTHFFQAAGQKELTSFQKMTMMKSEDVVKIGIDALLKNRPSVIPGWFNNVLIFLQRFLPRKWVIKISSSSMK